MINGIEWFSLFQNIFQKCHSVELTVVIIFSSQFCHHFSRVLIISGKRTVCGRCLHGCQSSLTEVRVWRRFSRITGTNTDATSSLGQCRLCDHHICLNDHTLRRPTVFELITAPALITAPPPPTFYFIFMYYHPLDDLFPDFLLYFHLLSPT